MRGEMARHKPANGSLDVKLSRGGLVDIEFLVHYLQLRDHLAFDPSLPAAIAALVGAGLLPAAMIGAQDMLGRFLIAARLLAPDSQEPPPAAREVLASACQCGDWGGLLNTLFESRAAVAAAWHATFGETLEI
jgi:glutamate-ammonia-ligase adenylyltransferase